MGRDKLSIEEQIKIEIFKNEFIYINIKLDSLQRSQKQILDELQSINKKIDDKLNNG